MFSSSFESLFEQSSKLKVRWTGNPAKDFNILDRQLERCCFEANVARCVGQDEAKVDVYKVAISVKKYVSVVAILDLK